MMDSALWRMAARNAGMWYFCREPGWRDNSTGLLRIVGTKVVLTGTAAGEVLHWSWKTPWVTPAAAPDAVWDQGGRRLPDQCGSRQRCRNAYTGVAGLCRPGVHVAPSFSRRRSTAADAGVMNLSMMSMRAVP